MVLADVPKRELDEEMQRTLHGSRLHWVTRWETWAAFGEAGKEYDWKARGVNQAMFDGNCRLLSPVMPCPWGAMPCTWAAFYPMSCHAVLPSHAPFMPCYALQAGSATLCQGP